MGKQALKAWWAGCALALAMAKAMTPAAATVLVLNNTGSDAYAAAARTFENEFGSIATNPALTYADLDRLSPEERNQRLGEPHELILALGPEAVARSLELETTVPVLALFVRRAEMERQNQRHPGRLTGIYFGQPPSRVLAMARALGVNEGIGILLSAESAPWLSEPLLQASADTGQDLLLWRMRPTDSPLRQFESLLERSKLIVALPDPGVYNSQNLQSLMLNAYRHRLPVIGYSSAMVKAGALAAVYSDPVLLGRQAAALAQRLLARPDALPPPEYPSQYALAVNYQVARSLALTGINEDVLRQAIVRQENPQKRTP